MPSEFCIVDIGMGAYWTSVRVGYTSKAAEAHYYQLSRGHLCAVQGCY